MNIISFTKFDAENRLNPLTSCTMRITYLLLSISSLLSAISCSSDSSPVPSSNFSSSPEALATEDLKSGGIYKGVIVGSSGMFVVRLQKGVKHITITLDGVSKELSPTGLVDWTTGLPIKNAVFVSGDWQAIFSVGATGLVPSLTLDIPGHANAQVVILKETSKAIVRAYEGTYAGSESGTWNFIIQAQALVGVSRSADGLTSQSIYGLADGTTLNLTAPVGTGTLSGDNASGTWQGSSAGVSGTWTGKRVL